MKKQGSGETPRAIQPPPGVPEYAWPAWVSCLQWALGEAECRAAFEAETGLVYRVPRAPIEAMIDEATGAAQAYIEAFVPWFNMNIWGAWDSSSPPAADHES